MSLLKIELPAEYKPGSVTHRTTDQSLAINISGPKSMGVDWSSYTASTSTPLRRTPGVDVIDAPKPSSPAETVLMYLPAGSGYVAGSVKRRSTDNPPLLVALEVPLSCEVQWVFYTQAGSVTPKPDLIESPDGWTIPRDGTELIDGNLNTWTIEAGTNRILRGGVQVAGATGSSLFITNHVVKRIGMDGHTYRWASNAWTDETVVTVTESPEGFTVPTNGSQLVDASLAIWTIEANTHFVLRNGAQVGGVTASALFIASHVVKRLGLDSHVYHWTGTVWVDETVVTIVGSPNGTKGATAVDRQGKTWVIDGANNVVLVDGAPYFGAWAAVMEMVNDILYIKGPQTCNWMSDNLAHTWPEYDTNGKEPLTNQFPPADSADGTFANTVNFHKFVWTRGPATANGFQVMRDGVAFLPGQAGTQVKTFLVFGGVLYWTTNDGNWYGLSFPNTTSYYGVNDPRNPTPPPPPPPTGVVTTGNIAQGATVITNVADTSIFPQNLITAGKLYLVIEIGGESGQGLRGTNGVGGHYPYGQVQNESEVFSYGGYEALTLGVLSTGQVWRYTAQQGGWVPNESFANGRYYGSWICPIALNARVLSKTANTITIDTPASVGANNANIHVDYWQVAMDTIANTANGGTINWNNVFPGLTSVCLGDTLWMQSRSGLTFTCNSEGSFQFYAPYGSAGIGLYWDSCQNCVWKFANIIGNWQLNKEKFGMGWASAHPGGANMNPPLADDENDRGGRLMRGPKWNACGGCYLQDCTIDYTNGGAHVLTNSGDCHAIRVKHHNVTHVDYFQWQFDYYFCDNCSQVDCEIYCDSGPLSGFELYCCFNSQIIRPKGRNAYCALNTCQGCRFGSDPNNVGAGGGELRFTLNHFQLIDWETPYIQADTAAIDINTNSGNWPGQPQGNNVVDGVNFVIEDYCHPTDKDITLGIHASSSCWNNVVTNCHYQSPNYSAPATKTHGAQLLWSDAGFSAGQPGTNYGGNTVIGTARNDNPQHYNIYSLGGGSLGGNSAGTAYPSLP